MDTSKNIFDGVKQEDMYVGFVDVLGFGRQVEEDYEGITAMYSNVIDNVIAHIGMQSNVSIRIMSDSIIVSAKELVSIIVAVNTIHHYTLFHDCLIRGGIAYGSHIEVSDTGNLYVVSQALVRAVQIEKRVKYPCVAFHDNVEIPPLWWIPPENNFLRKLIYYDGMRIVSPFNIMWGLSAKTRVEYMLEKYPEYTEKYTWFLSLYEAVRNKYLLVPPEVIKLLEFDKYAMNAS